MQREGVKDTAVGTRRGKNDRRRKIAGKTGEQQKTKAVVIAAVQAAAKMAIVALKVARIRNARTLLLWIMLGDDTLRVHHVR